MLTVLDALSIAGDRAKQNDDAYGAGAGLAWVIDGATDLYSPPWMGWASDAAWIGHGLNRALYAGLGRSVPLAERVAAAAADLQAQFLAVADPAEGWRRPAASMLIAEETPDGAMLLELGDCRAFTLDAAGAASAYGGPPAAADTESADAARLQAAAANPAAAPLDRAEVIAALREKHLLRNRPGGWWVFAADPACVAHARTHALKLPRPAHLLLASDGFSALVDRYGAFDAGGLMRAALAQGLPALVDQLRAIETADAGGAAHPRFKKSDDATALLLRLS